VQSKSLERGTDLILSPVVERKTSENASAKEGFANFSAMENDFFLAAIRKAIQNEAFMLLL
jgi:hypothetical protein